MPSPKFLVKRKESLHIIFIHQKENTGHVTTFFKTIINSNFSVPLIQKTIWILENEQKLRMLNRFP